MHFSVTYDMTTRGLPTLFRWQYFTIDAAQRKDWDYDNLHSYLTDYTLTVSDAVLEQYAASPVVYDLLQELKESQSVLTISNNKSIRYTGTHQYVKARLPMPVLCIFKRLFISTLVFEAAHQTIPQGESVTFQFDPATRTVCIEALVLYQPVEDPFFCYARNAVNTLSVEAIGLRQYGTNQEAEIKDFYAPHKMSGWKKREKLEQDHAIQNVAGIYMLYNEHSRELYIGKAIDLQNRIRQHGESPDDIAYHYTHYRYSAIAEEYYPLLYLIENMAIHDAAWILNMPSATHFTPSLSRIFSLTDCKLVNRVEHQTRTQR